MTDTTNTQKRSSPLSPGTIFLISVVGSLLNPVLGAILGFTLLGSNFRRAGEKRSVLLCFMFAIFSLLILSFIYPERPTIYIFPSDWSLYGYLVYFIAAEAVILGITYFAIQQSKKPETLTVANSYRFELMLGLSILAGYMIISFGMNQIFKLAGYCEAPRIYDILLRNAEKGREGLETILVQRSDLGCGWRWISDKVQMHQSSKDDSIMQANGMLSGDYKGDFTTIYQFARLFEKEITPEQKNEFFGQIEPGKQFDIDIPNTYGAKSKKVNCIDSEYRGIKTCTVLVEYEHTLLRLVIVSMYSPEQFAETVDMALAGVSTRALEYESTIP